MSDIRVIAVDWGTTSFRLWAMGGDGAIILAHHGERGMSTLRPAEFEGVLIEVLDDLNISSNIPVIICGMAGAAQGWVEAPYIDLPVTLKELPHWAIRVPNSLRDIRIIPGLAQRDLAAPDVMRGEETLLLGAYLEHGLQGSVCLPGTHSKWVQLVDGVVKRFSTVMTGELFALLAKSSTLSSFIDMSHDGHDTKGAFERAIAESLTNPDQVLRSLFSIRSESLLFANSTKPSMAARLSGMLVGLEIASMCKTKGDHVTLISTGVLAQTYLHAFDIAGMSCRLISADEMAQAGLHYAAKNIWQKHFMQ